jgi:hypothetical protein
LENGQWEGKKHHAREKDVASTTLGRKGMVIHC